MATAAPSGRYMQHYRRLREIAGPGYGRPDPEKDPNDPDDEFSLEKLLRQIWCWLKLQATGQKCQRDDQTR